jgi:hypothetical protein
VALNPPLDFGFDSLDLQQEPARSRVSATATRGKPTVIAFVTTGSLSAQAQVNFLVAMAGHDGDRVNYAVVVLEAPENRELVDIYRRSLAVSFPMATLDPSLALHAGGFGDVTAVPVTVVLDRAGRVVLRVDGRVVRSEELRKSMFGL